MSSGEDIDVEIIRRVSEAGELMLRAVNTLGSLTREQQHTLVRLTNGGLPDCALIAFASAARVVPDLQRALKDRSTSQL